MSLPLHTSILFEYQRYMYGACDSQLRQYVVYCFGGVRFVECEVDCL